MGSKFGIFGGLRLVGSLILVDEPRFAPFGGTKFSFSGFVPGFSGHYWLKPPKHGFWAFCWSSKGFKVRF